MTVAPNLLQRVRLILLVPLVLSLPTMATGNPIQQPANYRLAVSFDTTAARLTGTATIDIGAGEPLFLTTAGLRITGILLKKQDGQAGQLALPTGSTLTVPAERGARKLVVDYSYQPRDHGQNRIAADGITLLSGWYPQPHKEMRYRLSASLPDNLIGIGESDTWPLPRDGDTVTAALSQPLPSIHFIAAPYQVDSLTLRDGLAVHTLFFAEDRELARGYLDKAREFIQKFESEIGPYPYTFFAIVANRAPTGLGMPTFTLLGQQVLRLPFIKETSLGHEILHSWFGNAIAVQSRQGNWCEGLTSYLADYAFRAEKGEGLVYRKEAILNYLSYVHENNVIALADFTDPGQDQPQARARRAVGYSRAMLLFHELAERMGQEAFMQGVRTLYREHRYSSASWDDLRQAFADQLSGDDLERFFRERLTRTDIPAFHVRDIQTGQRQDTSLLRFTLIQDSEEPYSLAVPVEVQTAAGSRTFVISTDEKEKAVELELTGRPLSFTLDPQMTLLRQLAPEESPPIWARFLGSDQPLAILASQKDTARYQPLLSALALDRAAVHSADEVKNGSLANHDLLLLGLDQPAVDHLFAGQTSDQSGLSLTVRDNPLAPGRVAVLIDSHDPRQTAMVAQRLSHYGQYGTLRFKDGRLIDKRVAPSADGIRYTIDELPTGGAVNQLAPFAAMARELARYDVIYLGEQHTSVSDHLLQLRLIEALAELVPDLAIGMEMFPATVQPILDRYVLPPATMSEREFLKKSRYYEVWQYDYRYFREIFNLARQKNIPVRGLNLERNIVSSVYQNGGTDQLAPELRNTLVQRRDLALPGYGKRLQLIQSMHQTNSHGQGKYSGFIQAQALWDETMASHIVQTLQQHPHQKMVVLAGNEHTRKDSGIPPRVARELPVRQATVINISDEPAPANLAAVADYFFFSEPRQLSPLPMLGVMLEEKEDNGLPSVVIRDFSPTSKGSQAGLQKDDRITRIGDLAVSSMADIRIAMLETAGKTSTEVEVARSENSITKRQVFTVPLLQSAREQPH